VALLKTGPATAQQYPLGEFLKQSKERPGPPTPETVLWWSSEPFSRKLSRYCWHVTRSADHGLTQLALCLAGRIKLIKCLSAGLDE
jgi:hypothetical protein